MIRKNILRTIFLVLLISSCQEETISIDTNLLIGEWDGKEIWEGLINNESNREPIINNMNFNIGNDGEGQLFINRNGLDTVDIEWFYADGALFLIKEENAIVSDSFLNYYEFVSKFEILSLDKNNISLRNEYSFHSSSTENLHTNIFNWELTKR